MRPHRCIEYAFSSLRATQALQLLVASSHSAYVGTLLQKVAAHASALSWPRVLSSVLENPFSVDAAAGMAWQRAPSSWYQL